uniref:Uncharacterized protein n=1 Tax=Rhodnius prolixus TaxID=13249 RepID=T1H9W5_RHOPR
MVELLEDLVVERKTDELVQAQRRTEEAITSIQRTLARPSPQPPLAAEVERGVSFAAIVARQAEAAPPRQQLVVTTREGATPRTADEEKAAIKAVVKPVDGGWQVAGMKRRGPNSVLIETSSAAQASSIAQCPNLAGADLVVRPLGKLRPRIIVYGVPRALTEGEVLAAIKGQNFPNINEERFRESVKLVFKTGPRDRDMVNWVLEVTPEMRDIIKAQVRLYIEWNSCRVDDHLTVTRCYKCQALGHV